jgi:hypothetical protein
VNCPSLISPEAMANLRCLAEGPRCSEFCFDTAEFVLEYCRSLHRHGGPLLLPPGIGEFDEFV